MLDDLESGGAIYRSQNLADNALKILKNHGLNSVRLRLFHTPSERRDGLEDMLALAQRANDLNLTIIFNLHYSDIWADPGAQQKPSVWSNLLENHLTDSVDTYTYNVIKALEKQGTPPIIVQTGNEITTECYGIRIGLEEPMIAPNSGVGLPIFFEQRHLRFVMLVPPIL